MKKINLVILFSGNGSNLANIIHKFKGKKFMHNIDKEVLVDIACCITNNPSAYGILRCKDLGVKCEVLSHKDFKTRETFDEALSKLVLNYSPDLTVLAGFMRILSPNFTSQIRSINIHPSILPKYKGYNAIRDTYESDDEFGGVSVHWVSDELDGGEIILQNTIPKIAGEDFESFEQRIHQLEYKLYPNAICKALNLTSVVNNG